LLGLGLVCVNLKGAYQKEILVCVNLKGAYQKEILVCVNLKGAYLASGLAYAVSGPRP